MTLTLSQPDPVPEPGVIRLTGHGSTVTAEDLRAELVLAADSGSMTSIDASELLSVGQAVLQLLIAARQDAALHNHPFHFTGASAAFAERVVGCQLAESIGLDAGKEGSL